MQLSKRIRNLKPSATLAVNAVVQRLRAEGRDVIGFGAGEPDFETPDNIKQAAIDALGRGETHYTAVSGAPTARQAIADKLRNENGIACGPDDIVITVGGKHGLYMIFQCLLDTDLGQEGSGDINKINSSLKSGSAKPSHISNYTSSKVDQ